MKQFFYTRLATVNLMNNRSTYLPYMLTCVCAIMTYYIMMTIAGNTGLDQMVGSSDLKMILWLGVIVIAIFSAVLMFYTNSFLMKRRKKELGLYSILGMEKRHIARLFSCEMGLVAAACLALGLVGGMLFGKLLFLILLLALRQETPIVYEISTQAISSTLLLFTAIFIATLLFNLVQIRVSRPLALLKGSQEGEREPKTSWLLAIFGVLALGSGYVIAVTIQSPLEAITLFFLAVLLVIAGTFALFTAGSVAVLKLLRKNRGFYYQPDHFIAVSGMIYRMKQNAAGLSAICILSTMVLITVSTTVSLYIGQNDMLYYRYPKEIALSFEETPENAAAARQLIAGVTPGADLDLETPVDYRYLAAAGFLQNNKFEVYSDSVDVTNITMLTLVPLEDYNRLENRRVTLRDQEILLFDNSGEYAGESLTIGDIRYQVKERLDSIKLSELEGGSFRACYAVVKDMGVMDAAGKAFALPSEEVVIRHDMTYEVTGPKESVIEYDSQLQNALKNAGDFSARLECRELYRGEWAVWTGGFMFIGVFLGLLFLMATVLIIYYKQISEGYDDHTRFRILQEVGMSQREVRQTIGQQIRMVFFLPLVVAVVHVAFAFGIMCKLLLLFGLSNMQLYFLCVASTALVFTAVYSAVYFMTARTYYRLVR